MISDDQIHAGVLDYFGDSVIPLAERQHHRNDGARRGRDRRRQHGFDVAKFGLTIGDHRLSAISQINVWLKKAGYLDGRDRR